MKKAGVASLLVVLLLLLLAPAAGADSFDWTFAVIPAGGQITGAPGQTVGWGYTITNLSSSLWLTPADFSAGGFQVGVPNLLFFFPVVAPETTLTVQYLLGLQGLFEVALNEDATVGSFDAGPFDIRADFFDGDPFVNGNFFADAGTRSATYQVTVAPASTPVPEIPGWLVVTSGVVGLGICVSLYRRLDHNTPLAS